MCDVFVSLQNLENYGKVSIGVFFYLISTSLWQHYSPSSSFSLFGTRLDLFIPMITSFLFGTLLFFTYVTRMSPSDNVFNHIFAPLLKHFDNTQDSRTLLSESALSMTTYNVLNREIIARKSA
jgi:hypothetical protein